MSMQPAAMDEIPAETRQVAQAAFPKGNLYMRMRDELGVLYRDERFAELFPVRGQPAESPGRLALVTVMQFAEGMSDRDAANAVRARIDWKYALGLELTDPGFNFSVLSEFRSRLLAGQREQLLFESLLEVLKARKLLKARGRQRTDSTHVLAAIRALNRLELIGESLRLALNALAEAAPDWLRSVAKPEWFARYALRFESSREPTPPAERLQVSEAMGADGAELLEAVRLAPQHECLRQLPAVELLRHVWLQQFYSEHRTDSTVHIRLRAEADRPPGAQSIHSPYDPEARFSSKRVTDWVGYKAFLTESCDEEGVHLITQVETSPATSADSTLGQTIHASLAAQDLLPSIHLMDAAFIGAQLLVQAKQEHQVDILGPAMPNVRWQAKEAKGFSQSDFHVDWQTHTVTCPREQVASSWTEQTTKAGQPFIYVRFKASVCRACPVRNDCTRSVQGARSLMLHPQAEYEALQAARRNQETAEFRKQYAQRSGIEGTISQGTRAFGMRAARYVGLAKTRLQILATATAINLHRLFDFWTEVPRAVTRVSAFARLAPDPALLRRSWRSA
jgi:transposase